MVGMGDRPAPHDAEAGPQGRAGAEDVDVLHVHHLEPRLGQRRPPRGIQRNAGGAQPGRVEEASALGIVIDIDLELAGAGVQLFRQRTMTVVELLRAIGRGGADLGHDRVGRLGLVAVVRADGEEVVELQVAVDPGALTAGAGAGASRIRRRQVASGGRAQGACRWGDGR